MGTKINGKITAREALPKARSYTLLPDPFTKGCHNGKVLNYTFRVNSFACTGFSTWGNGKMVDDKWRKSNSVSLGCTGDDI